MGELYRLSDGEYSESEDAGEKEQERDGVENRPVSALGSLQKVLDEKEAEAEAEEEEEEEEQERGGTTGSDWMKDPCDSEGFSSCGVLLCESLSSSTPNSRWRDK